MVEWLDANVAYWHWIVIGLVLAVAEIVVPTFFLFCLGIAAVLVGIISAVVQISFVTQLLLWIVLSIVLLVAWFRFVSPMIKTRSLSGMAKEAAIGQRGIVTEFDEQSGRGNVRFTVPLLGKSEWSFICDDQLSVGDHARVKDVVGNSLLVTKA